MAMAYVGGVTAAITGSAATTTTISLTGLTGGVDTTARAGDIVVVGAANSWPNTFPVISDGGSNYTSMATRKQSGGSRNISMRVAYKVMGGSPDATVSIGPSGDTGVPIAVAVSVWRNPNATPSDATATTAGSDISGLPNPASITPVTVGAVILAFGGGSVDVGLSNLTNGAGDLSNFIAVKKDTASYTAVHMAVGSKVWASGAFDAGAFTGFTDNSAYGYVAITVAIRPGPEQILFFDRHQYFAYTRI